MSCRYNFNEQGDKIIDLNLKEVEKINETETYTHYPEGENNTFFLVDFSDEIPLFLVLENPDRTELSDGRTVTQEIFVVSAREKLQMLMPAGGIRMNYTDADMAIWDINPDGNWLN